MGCYGELTMARVAKAGYVTGNFLILHGNYQNFDIFQGFHVIYHNISSGLYGYFRLSKVSVIMSGSLWGLITCKIYDIIK
jgi:hypothetical protein